METYKESIESEGYRQIELKELKEEMRRVCPPIHFIHIAYELRIKSTQTLKNAFMDIDKGVSDELLSKLLDFLGIDSWIIWYNGQRSYFIKKQDSKTKQNNLYI